MHGKLWTAAADGLLCVSNLRDEGEDAAEKPACVQDLMKTAKNRSVSKPYRPLIFESVRSAGVRVMARQCDQLLCGTENGEIIKIQGMEIVQRRRIHQSQVLTMAPVFSQAISPAVLHT